MSNKSKYIQENIDDTIDLRKKNKMQVISLLSDKGYTIIDGDKEYKYLTKMPMDSVTQENAERIFNEKVKKDCELEEIKNTSPSTMWLNELNDLTTEYLIYKENRDKLNRGDYLTKVIKKPTKRVCKTGV